MAAVLLSVALASARTYLNDDSGSNWSDAALIPKIQDAHRELQTMLWEVGSPAVRKQSAAITVAANAVDLGTDQPADILSPFRMVEYAATVETLADATEMTEVFFIPNIAQTTKLNYWAWKEEKIVFLGASAGRKVIVYYRKLIPVPVIATDPIGILFGELYLGARAAAITYGTTGNAAAYATTTEFARANFQKVVAAQRGQQSPMQRP